MSQTFPFSDRPSEEVAFYYNKIAFGYDAATELTSSETQTPRKTDDTEG